MELLLCKEEQVGTGKGRTEEGCRTNLEKGGCCFWEQPRELGAEGILGAEVTWVQGHLGESVAEKSTVDSSVQRSSTWLEKPLKWAVGRLGKSVIKLCLWCPVLVSLSQCVLLANV